MCEHTAGVTGNFLEQCLEYLLMSLTGLLFWMGKFRNRLSSEFYMTDNKEIERISPPLQKYLQRGAVLPAQE